MNGGIFGRSRPNTIKIPPKGGITLLEKYECTLEAIGCSIGAGKSRYTILPTKIQRSKTRKSEPIGRLIVFNRTYKSMSTYNVRIIIMQAQPWSDSVGYSSENAKHHNEKYDH
jgi:hypothetical protein